MVNNHFLYCKKIAEHYGLQEDRLVKNLLTVLSIIPEDAKTAKLLIEYIYGKESTKKKQKSSNPFPTPTPQVQKEDDIVIGKDENENPYFLPIKNLVKILVFYGGIGFGKTTAIINAVLQLVKKGIRCLIIDYKRDYRRLATIIPIVILRFSQKPNFKWNPLQEINGTSPLEQDTTFATTLAEAEYLREGSINILVETLQKLRTQKKNPTIKDLHDAINALPYKYGREGEWKASSLRALRSLLISFNEMLSCEEGLDLIRLINDNNVCMEMDNAGSHKSFFSTLTENYYLLYKKNNNIRGTEVPIHVNICDEGLFLFGNNLQKKSPTGCLSIIGNIQTGREFGEAWIIATNEPANMADSIKNNAANKILMRMGDWKNILDANNSMASTKEQADQTVSLRVGEAIAQIEGNKSHKITLTNIDLPSVYPSDEEIKKLSAVTIKEYSAITPPQAPLQESQPKQEEKPTLAPEEEALLKDIAHNITLPKTEHYRRAGLSPDKGDRTYKKISKEGLASEFPVNLGATKRLAKILYLTPKGYDAIGEKPSHKASRGESPEHSFWIHYYSNQLTKGGFKTKISHSIKGKEVDIAVLLEKDSAIAIEICITTTAEHETEQAQKNLTAGYSHVITITKDKGKAEKILELATQQSILQNKITVSPFVPDICELMGEAKRRKENDRC